MAAALTTSSFNDEDQTSPATNYIKPVVLEPGTAQTAKLEDVNSPEYQPRVTRQIRMFRI